eukprot:SAG31_NODE_244_length_19246_cov_20.233823_3_plen_65_part_00
MQFPVCLVPPALHLGDFLENHPDTTDGARVGLHPIAFRAEHPVRTAMSRTTQNVGAPTPLCFLI